MWAPGYALLERVAFPPIRTFDSSRTPKLGERLMIPRTLAEVDLTAIVAALAAAGAEDPRTPRGDPYRVVQIGLRGMLSLSRSSLRRGHV